MTRFRIERGGTTTKALHFRTVGPDRSDKVGHTSAVWRPRVQSHHGRCPLEATDFAVLPLLKNRLANTVIQQQSICKHGKHMVRYCLAMVPHTAMWLITANANDKQHPRPVGLPDVLFFIPVRAGRHSLAAISR